MKEQKKVWVLGVCSSEGDSVLVLKYLATKSQIKKKIVNFVKEDKEEDDSFDDGTTSIGDLKEEGGTIYGYACFSDHHIDYEAYVDSQIEVTELDDKGNDICPDVEKKVCETDVQAVESCNVEYKIRLTCDEATKEDNLLRAEIYKRKGGDQFNDFLKKPEAKVVSRIPADIKVKTAITLISGLMLNVSVYKADLIKEGNLTIGEAFEQALREVKVA